ncbi:MAG TPA: hypothetical protein PKA64_24405 [Myxococcota bacterium]|nr:hypothetical protein [Myxococcota bacterium]
MQTLRKIRDARDARLCLDAAATSSQSRVEWARAQGIDPRSLNAWRINLGVHRAPSQPASAPGLRLVERVAPAAPPPSPRLLCTIRQHDPAVDLPADLADHDLDRVLRAVRGC